jgi:hypothetical protein
LHCTAFTAVTGEKPTSSAFKSFTLLYNAPGCSAVDEGTAAAKSVAVALYTTGLLTFSIFLGVVANEIGTRVAAVQAGNFRVVDRGHTVLLVRVVTAM